MVTNIYRIKVKQITIHKLSFSQLSNQQATTSFWRFEAVVKVENNFVNEMTDIVSPRTADKQCPIMCESFACWLIEIHCSMSKFYHNLYRLPQQITLPAEAHSHFEIHD